MLVSRFKEGSIQGVSTLNQLRGTFESASESNGYKYIMATATPEHRVIYADKSLTAVQLERLTVQIKKTPSASRRIMDVIGKIWIGILLIVTLVLIVGLASKPTESLSAYLLSFAWQRGINIFSITTMFIIILSFAFALKVLKKLMSVLGKALNASAETACQLLVSLLSYAGISIITERDYKVGDIVNIGGFCGKVIQIGIRTTKVEDIEGNVKIFYNSGVSGVVNMTSKPSSVKLDAKHSFEDAEKSMKKFFERIEGKYPQIKGECRYLGVQDSTSAFNVFRFSVPCDEIERAPLSRSLVKELSVFCKEENIVKL